MRPSKGEQGKNVVKGKLEVEIEKKIIEQLQVMEDFTKLSKADLVTTALKRFISQHKDYFPEDYHG